MCFSFVLLFANLCRVNPNTCIQEIRAIRFVLVFFFFLEKEERIAKEKEQGIYKEKVSVWQLRQH